MIEYVGQLKDLFWIDDLKKFKFDNQTPIATRDDYHRNYLNPPIFLKQNFGSAVPQQEKFLQSLNIRAGTVCWLCLEPRELIPVHQDHFYKLRQETDALVEDCVRYLIMLEDWQLGHSVQFATYDLPRWRAGDVWVFDSAEKHSAANSGTVNFCSCQISALRIDCV